MRARTSYLLVGVLAVASLIAIPAGAQSSFEGVVTFQMDASPDGPQTMQYSAKGNKVRIDVSANGMQMFTLFDGATKTVDMVIPMRQMYMERTMESAQATADSAMASSKVQWTGTKETIAGYECEHANISDNRGQITDVCLAKGLGTFVAMGGGMGRSGVGMGRGWEGHIGQAFPLKVTSNGSVEMVVTKIEKKPIDDSIFVIPNGYQKMNVPGGGQ